MLITAARASGVSAYIEDGSNRWPAVHRLDAANLYRLALEKAPAGETLHAVGEEAIPFRTIADKIGAKLNLPTTSVKAADAATHFGNPFMAVVFSTDAPVSSQHTQQLLRWRPNHWTLLEDLDNGDYFTTPTSAERLQHESRPRVGRPTRPAVHSPAVTLTSDRRTSYGAHGSGRR